MSGRVIGVISIVCASLISSLAYADNEEAKARYRHGTAAFALGKYAEAAKDYETAFELAPEPALLFNAAQAHRMAGNNARALELYTSYLRVFGASATNRAEVRRQIAELKKLLEAQQQVASAPPTAPAQPKLEAAPGRDSGENRTQAPAQPFLSDWSSKVAGQPATLPAKEAQAKREAAATVMAPPPATTGAVVSSPALGGERPVERTPLHKKAWFWGVIAGGAAVVAGAVAVGVVLGQRDSHNTLPLARF